MFQAPFDLLDLKRRAPVLIPDLAERHRTAGYEQRHQRRNADRNDVAGLQLKQLGDRDVRTRQHAARLQPDVRQRRAHPLTPVTAGDRSEEHTSELQSLMRTSYAVSGLKTHTILNR